MSTKTKQITITYNKFVAVRKLLKERPQVLNTLRFQLWLVPRTRSIREHGAALAKVQS